MGATERLGCEFEGRVFEGFMSVPGGPGPPSGPASHTSDSMRELGARLSAPAGIRNRALLAYEAGVQSALRWADDGAFRQHNGWELSNQWNWL